MKTEFYFAYGSNLNEEDWETRTGLRFSDAFQKYGIAYLLNARLAFTRKSVGRKGGVLDIVSAPNRFVEGQIYRIKNEDALNALDSKEGAPSCYKREERVVFTPTGKPVSVFTYKAVEQAEYVEPHSEYVKIVAEGLRNFGMSTEQLHAAAKNEPVPPLNSFFCYGTLRNGECRYHVMEEFDILSEEESGTIPGTLYDCGSYPGAVIDTPETNRCIAGEIIRVRKVEEAIKRLDAIEGFSGFDSSNSLFCRRIVPVELASGKTEPAWVYVYNCSVDHMEPIRNGNWVNR
ncbi:MAG: gamma-glutamylcyclotransferase [Planctomycetaceae bacterium]|nr:gamma-glutamylcyclotransferase [Planctomycetaceae bacterium]